MEIGLFVPAVSPMATPELLAAVGAAADERGIATIWVGEHVVQLPDYASSYPYAADGRMPLPDGTGMLEPFTTLAFLAACTTRVRLGTAICLLAQRNPVYAAKETATLDWLSGGRLDLGIGAGWLREEYEAVGVPWADRGRRTDEAVAVLRRLWSGESADGAFEGDFYTVPACTLEPRPRQDPHPPLHIGGESDAALQRVARVGDGWHSFNRLPEDVGPALGRLEDVLAAAGRSRADITVTVCPYLHGITPERVEAYAEAGVDQVSCVLVAFTPDDVSRAFDSLEPCLARAATP